MNLFPDQYYQTSLIYDEKEKLIDEIETRYNETPTVKPESWSEDVHTSFSYEQPTNLGCYTRSYIPLSLVEKINTVVQEFVVFKNLSKIGIFRIDDIWYNAYKGTQYQHPHKHGNALFSGIYYLKFNKKVHNSTLFYNPHFEFSSEYMEMLKETPFFAQKPDVQENDIFIFPSGVAHKVDASYSNEMRITVAFNVICDFYNIKNYSYQ